ncbi:MAG: hypothetical protein NZ585_08830 [Chloracidobacterium sp.]|nr:hypothetical protein [Chloracidobacterium sp.]MDW8217408.1 hypothetical protein [Acidobacteriota bacterium]
MDKDEWDIRRQGRSWRGEEFFRRLEHKQSPEKIEYVDGCIFGCEEERMTVLAMLLENLGIDKAVRLGNLADWKAAIAELEAETKGGSVKNDEK